MWFVRRIMRVSCTDKPTNMWVLLRAQKQGSLMKISGTRQIRFMDILCQCCRPRIVATPGQDYWTLASYRVTDLTTNKLTFVVIKVLFLLGRRLITLGWSVAARPTDFRIFRSFMGKIANKMWLWGIQKCSAFGGFPNPQQRLCIWTPLQGALYILLSPATISAWEPEHRRQSIIGIGGTLRPQSLGLWERQ